MKLELVANELEKLREQNGMEVVPRAQDSSLFLNQHCHRAGTLAGHTLAN